MRHKVKGRKLSRTHSHRKAMFRNMVTSLLRHERIITTLPKAKELRGVADRCITYGKKGSLHHRRLAARLINDKDVVNTLFTEFAERYETRPGGYTRIIRLGWRKGDAAEMAVIELVDGNADVIARRRPSEDQTEEGGEVTSKESFE
ncbi:MAG: large subunit ribosomal protein L17 [Myxococcota bacterium]|jgi:large subunit ribosomal protein L17